MTRDDLLAGIKREPVPFEAAGKQVYLRPMSAIERSEFGKAHKADPDKLYARCVVYGLCDAGGNRLLTPADLDAVADLDGLFAEKVAERFILLNGMGDDGPKA